MVLRINRVKESACVGSIFVLIIFYDLWKNRISDIYYTQFSDQIKRRSRNKALKLFLDLYIEA